MDNKIDRRQFLKLTGLGGVVFASGLSGWANAAKKTGQDAQDPIVQDALRIFGGTMIDADHHKE